MDFITGTKYNLKKKFPGNIVFYHQHPNGHEIDFLLSIVKKKTGKVNSIS